MQPVIIEDAISIAANSTNDNVIVSNSALRKYLRAPFQAQGKFICTQSAAGLRVDLDYGSKNVISSIEPRVGTDLQDPLDMISDDWYPNEGDQLVVRVTNTTGGALTLNYRIVLDPNPVHDENGNPTQLPPDTRVMQRGPVALAIGDTNIQLLDGLRYERPPVDSTLEVFMTASGTGVTRIVDIDTENIAPPSNIPALNRIPQDPFDQVLGGIEVAQDKLIDLKVTNASGAARNVFWKAKVTELVRS